MSIELHCPKCSKLIRAPDEAGGKRGRCPYCKEPVYVPMPAAETDEIPLAPIDTDEDRRVEALREEAARYAAALDREASPPPEDIASGISIREETIDVPSEVEAYVIAMRDSRLEEAEASAERLKQVEEPARDHVERILADAAALVVDGVPDALVKGFLKTLLARL